MPDTASSLSSLLANASRIVVFTGAGISTESGVPDFRSPGGVWSRMKPIMFQDFCNSREARREAWSRVFNRTAGWTGAAPNAGHEAVARLVRLGKAISVITQNVDDLHRLSGVPEEKIVEIHGNASYAKCLDCASRYEFEALRPRWEQDEDITCEACGGLVKSATISFGQPMPQAEMMRASEAALECDLFLVLGSSLVVYPAASLPELARRNGAMLAIVNREPTPLDEIAHLVLHSEIGPTMSEAVRRLAAD